jgi:hypothetical protein
VKRKRSDFLTVGLFILVIIAIAGMTWVNHQYVDPSQFDDEFFPRWHGTRKFLDEGESPYTRSVSNEAQIQAYGRRARPSEDPLHFQYPFFAILYYAPFSLINSLNWARAAWMTVLEVCLVFTVVISIRLSRWKLPPLYLIPIFILAFGWIYTVYPLWEKSLSIIVVFFISAALLAIRNKLDILAGFLLLLASIKLNMVLLFILFVIIWAISRRRWYIIGSFLGWGVILLGVSLLIMPEWVEQYLRQIFPYLENPVFTNTWTVLQSWIPGIGRQLGWLLSGLFGLILIIEWVAAYKKDFDWFLWTAYLTLVISILIGIPSTTQNFVILLPVVILIMVGTADRWNIPGRVLLILSVLLLVGVFWGYYFLTAQAGFNIPNNPVFYLVLPLLTLIGLYWVRWWITAIRELPLQKLAQKLTD